MIRFRNASRIIIVPDADLQNEEVIGSDLQVKHSMNGDIKTHIKTAGMKRLTINISTLSRKKAEDLLEFLNSSEGFRIFFTDWDNVVWYGNLITTPIELITATLGSGDADRKEYTSVALVFEGVKL
jgi:hypothetical protein